jgi:hypothetical protein
MENDEAKHLIDQFNKFASWVARPRELFLVYFALYVATFSPLMAITAGRYGSPDTLLVAWGLLGFVVAFVSFYHFMWIRNVLDLFARKLVALEDFRRLAKSLPDTMTLATIIGSKPEELRQMLEEWYGSVER